MLLFYLMLLLPLAVYAVLSRTDRHESANRAAITCFFIILFLALALRGETVGRDIPGYKYYFEVISRSGWGEIFSLDLEPGFILLNKLVSLFTDNFQIFIAVTAAITVFPLCKIYREEIKNAGITAVLFINMSTFVMMFSGIRQAIAITLGVIAFKFVKEKKWIKFLIISAIAMTFHTSAFMLFLMYPVYHYKLKRNSFWLLTSIFAFCLIFNRQIMTVLMFLMPDRYSDTSLSYNNAYTMIILFAIFTAYSVIIPDERKLGATGRGLRNMLLLSTLLQTFAPVHPLSMRMNYYYIIFIPLMLPKIMNASEDKWKNTVELSKFIMLVFFTAYFFYMSTSPNSYIFPYHFFWEAV